MLSWMLYWTMRLRVPETRVLGHPNLVKASLAKNFPKMIPSLLHVFSGWYLQGLVIWCASLFRPQNIWCKRRHSARAVGDISSRDARISFRGCPNLPCLGKPGCPRLRKDAQTWIKMPEPCLTIRIRYHWLNDPVVLFLMVKMSVHGRNLVEW